MARSVRPAPRSDRFALLALLVASATSRFALVSSVLITGAVLTIAVRRSPSILRDRKAVLLFTYIALLALLAVIANTLVYWSSRFWFGEGRVIISLLILAVVPCAVLVARDARRLRMALVFVAGINAGVAFVQRFGIADLGRAGRATPAGFTSSHHAAGALGVAAVLVALECASNLSTRVRWVSGIAGVTLGLCALSRVALLAMVVCAVASLSATHHALASIRSKLSLIGGVLLVVLLVLLSPLSRQMSIPSPFRDDDVVNRGRAYNVERRFDYWDDYASWAVRSPLIGSGPWVLNDSMSTGFISVPPLIEISRSGDGGRYVSGFSSHNLVLQVITDTGLVGLALLVLWARRWWKSVPTWGATKGLELVRLTVLALVCLGLTATSIYSTAVAVPMALLLCLGRSRQSDTIARMGRA